jgi:hypothetical protein
MTSLTIIGLAAAAAVMIYFVNVMVDPRHR